MSKILSQNYDDIFQSLRKIIIERDFGEIINFESMLKEEKMHNLIENKQFNEEVEIIGLCAIYIFCIMLKKDEEDIFPFLKDYVLGILINTFSDMEEEYVKNQLDTFYDLNNNTIEQRFLFILAAFGYNSFNSSLGIKETDEFDNKVIDKLLLKIFLTNYTQFNTEVIRGLFLLYRYGLNFKNNLDASTLLLFESMLKRIILLLVNFNESKKNLPVDNEIIDQVEKINLV